MAWSGVCVHPGRQQFFLAIGVGAILQVCGSGTLAPLHSAGLPLINWVNLAGLVTGLALMYFTAFMVKF